MDSGPELLRELLVLQARRATGQLEVMAEGGHTLIYFVSGEVVYAESGGTVDTLGRVLLREGAIDRKQYRAVLWEMTEGLVEHEQLRFGEVAVRLGFLDAAKVTEGLRWQVRSRVFAALQHEDTTRYFDEGPAFVAGVPRFGLNLDPALRTALELFYDAPRLAGALEDAKEDVWRLVDPRETGSARFGFTAAEVDVAREFCSAQSLAAVLSRRSDALTLRVVLLLWVSGLVESVENVGAEDREGQAESPPEATNENTTEAAASPSPSAASTPRAEVGEAKRGSGESRRKRRRRSTMTRSFAEDVEDPARPSARPPAAAGGGQAPKSAADPSAARARAREAARARALALQRMTGRRSPKASPKEKPRVSAAQALGDRRRALEAAAAKRRPSVDPALAAATAFERGRKALEAGQPARAKAEFEASYGHDPTDEALLHLRWSEFLISDADGSTALKEEVSKLARACARADRRMAFAYYVIGRIALVDEDLERAAKALRRAAGLDDDFAMAQRYLRLVQRRRGQKK